MGSAFIGNWKLTESSNFDDFLKELGVNFVMRKLAQTASPVVSFSKDGDKWTMKTVTTLKSSVIQFKMGETFVEKRLDGQEVRTVVLLDGDKMTQKHLPDAAKGLKEVLITRWVEGNKLMVKAVVNDISCLRTYTKL